MSITQDWCKKEFSDIELGDYRLNQRFYSLVNSFKEHTGKSIYNACKDLSASKAAYRFFKNPRISVQKILAPHFRRTVERCDGIDEVLIIHDTTTAQFNSHSKMKGLGTIGGTKNSKGLLIHNTIATSIEGIALGLLGQHTIAKSKAIKGKNYHSIPIEEKATFRWIESMVAAEQCKPQKTRFIHIADRESDFYEFLVEAEKIKANYVIRGKWNRTLEDGETLRSELEKISSLVGIEVPIQGNGKRKHRIAKCQIKFCKMTLSPPIKMKHLPQIEINAVSIEEMNPSEKSSPIKWLLLTNLQITDEKDALKIIRYYKQRWKIEEFHKILKSAFKIEEIALETAERFRKMLAILSVLAVRLLWITYAARNAPKENCEIFLPREEWETLSILCYRKRVPKNKRAPTLHEVVQQMAFLGGYKKRKSDPPPGITVIWRGFKFLQDAMMMREALQESNLLKI